MKILKTLEVKGIVNDFFFFIKNTEYYQWKHYKEFDFRGW